MYGSLKRFSGSSGSGKTTIARELCLTQNRKHPQDNRVFVKLNCGGSIQAFEENLQNFVERHELNNGGQSVRSLLGLAFLGFGL